MGDIIGAQIVHRIAAIAFVKRHVGGAFGNVVQEITIVRGGKDHAGIVSDELAENPGGIGRIGDRLDIGGAQRREGGFDRFHPLVMRPGPAFVGRRPSVTECDMRVSFGHGCQRASRIGGFDHPGFRQDQTGPGSGAHIEKPTAGQGFGGDHLRGPLGCLNAFEMSHPALARDTL